MGDQNKIALEMLNSEIKALANLTQQSMNNLAIVAESSPYTKHLVPMIKQFGNNFKSRADSLYSENDNHFPKTLSKIVSLD